MSIFSKITLKMLLKNRMRTIVTIIGIILSAAMICALATSLSSFMDFGLRNMIYENGGWHGVIFSAPADVAEKISASDEVKACGSMALYGFSAVENKENSMKPYIAFMGIDDGFASLIPVRITGGRMPENGREIVIPEHLVQSGGIDCKIGDTVTFDIGDRLNEEGQNCNDGGYLNAMYDNTGEIERVLETLDVRESRTFTVVGFCKRINAESYSYPAYMALTYNDESAPEAFSYDVYFSMNKPSEVYSFIKENAGDCVNETNTNVLMFMLVSKYDDFYTVLGGFTIIIASLIVFGSVSLIYNAFSISVAERTKQFGLLSGIGATKKQLRRSVLFEALAVAVVGIPIGIAAGIGGIGVTLALLGDKFTSLGSNFSIPMRLCVSPYAIIAASLLALITVLISAAIPARRATRVCAVEAIRQSGDVKIGKSESRREQRCALRATKAGDTPPRKGLFGLYGTLAAKYFRRSKKKYRSTIISLFLSVVLFVSCSAFTGYLNISVNSAYESANFDISCYINPAKIKYDYKELLDVCKRVSVATGVTEAAFLAKSFEYVEIPDYLLTEEAKSKLADEDNLIGAQFLFVDDENFDKLLAMNGIDGGDYGKDNLIKAVVYDKAKLYNPEKGKYTYPSVLDGEAVGKSMEVVAISFSGGGDVVDSDGNPIEGNGEYKKTYTSVGTVTVGEVITKTPFFIEPNMGLCFIYRASAQCDVPESIMNRSHSGIDAYFLSDNPSKSYEEISAALRAMPEYTSYVNNVAKSVEQSRNVIFIVNTFAYGLIVLISLVAAANVFNTVSTNIMLRRRDFAMLRSVGMTSRGIYRMMNYECLLYGTKALLYGLPVSLVITVLLWLTVNEAFEISFSLPWVAIITAVLSVFAVVFATMIYSVSKIRNDDLTDVLKNENI